MRRWSIYGQFVVVWGKYTRIRLASLRVVIALLVCLDSASAAVDIAVSIVATRSAGEDQTLLSINRVRRFFHYIQYIV